jgi:hypothetical protein
MTRFSKSRMLLQAGEVDGWLVRCDSEAKGCDQAESVSILRPKGEGSDAKYSRCL